MFTAKSISQFKRPNAATIEHVIPKVQKGIKDYENEVAACRLCNNIRSADDPYEFFVWRQLHLTEDERALQKTIARYRRDKLKAKAAAEKEARYQACVDRAMQTPYISRVVAIALRQTFATLHSVLAKITQHKYRHHQPQPLGADGKADRNRSRINRGFSRSRHRRKNAVGGSDAGKADSGRQEDRV